LSDYDVDQNKKSASYLNSVWYQPEEVFPVSGTPEVRQHAFWVEVDKSYYTLSQKLEVTYNLITQHITYLFHNPRLEVEQFFTMKNCEWYLYLT
jgi:hypothetical protein